MRSDDPAQRSRATETISAAYWKPIYKYVRLKWNLPSEDAQDFTQEFLLHDPPKKLEIARMREFIGDRRDAKRRRVELPLVVSLIKRPGLNGARPQSMAGHTFDLSTQGLSFVVPHIRIGDHYRAIGQVTGDAVEWVWIGSHEDYNKL